MSTTTYVNLMTLQRHNSFDLLRLLLAGGVLITHGYLIGGYGATEPSAWLTKSQTNISEICVMGFFAISGYLIPASFERSKNILIFISHRLFRLLPGFWVCLIVTSFFFAPLIFLTTHRSLSDFPITGNEGAIGFIVHNALVQVRQWSIAGVLDFAAYNESLNGSLWSLFPELQCYLFTIIAGYFGLLKRNRILLLGILSYLLVLCAINLDNPGRYGPTIIVLGPALKLYTSYVAGMTLYVFRDAIQIDNRGVFFLLGVLMLLLKFGGYHLIAPILIATLIIKLAEMFKCTLKYDISYGIYIYGFPVQQLLYHWFGSSLHVSVYLLFSLLGASCFGVLSCLLIERPCMALCKKLDEKLPQFEFQNSEKLELGKRLLIKRK